MIGLMAGGPTGQASLRAGEIGYIEDFVLADDRQQALDQLIPGTEDYYFFHCLHLQHLQQYDQVDEMLQRWIKQHNYTDRVRQIQHRQALLTYDRNPAATLEYLVRTLGLRFDHQRESLEARPDLPTALDPQRLARDTLVQDAFARHQNLQGLTDAALDWLVSTELNAERRRHLLERLQRPDYPGLVRLVIDDLNTRGSRGFGSLNIHRQLLLPQLEECLRAEPSLRNEDQFVQIYLSKLTPSPDVDWRHDPAALREYLNRVWDFVETLSPTHNSLKALVLYQQLDLDRSVGTYSKERFMQYLQLPRPVSYVPRAFLQRPENRNYLVDLNLQPPALSHFGPIANDEPLVRDYFAHFFVEETTYRPYEAYVDDTYLKELFAETKLVHGLGDPEQWYALLPPDKLQRLKDRIDLDFAATNPTLFGANDPVALEMDVKNVATLLVKVYEINATNYYRSQGTEVNTDIPLDGLVANHERTVEYDEGPLRRVRRRFEFPEMDAPGIYVVDFIGNGKSSRAVVRKGKLNYLVREGSAGHVFTILGDDGQVVADASLWMAGHQYLPNEEGAILVPYSTNPARQSIILEKGNWASLHTFDHHAEGYQLHAGIHVDRESLLAHSDAELLVRPRLTVNGVPVAVSDLEQVELQIATVDVDGIETKQQVDSFELHDDRESVHTFHVPSRLRTLGVTLTAKIKQLSTGEFVDLQASAQFQVNGIDATQSIAAFHLLPSQDGYWLEYLGKSGEPRPHIAANITLQHRDFVQPVQVVLQTDERGRIGLGELPGIETVYAQAEGNVQQRWVLRDARYAHGPLRHAKVGEPILVPLVGDERLDRDVASLLEVRGNSFVADRFAAMEYVPGFLRITGLEAGDYDLWLKENDQRIRIRVTDGSELADYVVGDYRQLERVDPAPLQVTELRWDDDALKIHLANQGEGARVHVFATRYVPSVSAYEQLSGIPQAVPRGMLTPAFRSLYLEGRNIGDEYRYILDRRFAARFPGNMLDRPSLLLNPWALRDTQTEVQVAEEGEAFAADAEAPAEAADGAGGTRRRGGVEELGEFASLDFLAVPSVVLTNLRPNDEGVVTIARQDLGPHQDIHVMAIDAQATVYRRARSAVPEVSHEDLRLAESLDPAQHFAQQKQITAVPRGETFTIADMTASRMEVYDSLRRVFELYRVLGSDPRIAEFSFILDWPTLSTEEKHAKYSEFACHELNLFLYSKDPDFFRDVVEPYLANKLDKTFMDHWLLGGDLSPYLQPWRFRRLNVVEQSLLAHRLQAQRAMVARDVHDRWELLPRDTERWNLVFETALKGSALSTERDKSFGDLGLQRKGIALERQRALTLDAAPAAPAMGGMGGAVPASEPAPAGRPAADDSQVANNALAESRVPQRGRGVLRSDRARFAGKAASLYQQVDKTKEWVENNYYKLPIEQQVAELVTVDGFWKDFAEHAPDQPFRSTHFAEAAGNLTEMMCALALLDLPFNSPDHKLDYDQARLTLTASDPLYVFHEEISQAAAAGDASPVLVSQNFFRADDRFEMVQGERRDKFVTDEFLVHVVYGLQVVVTNPSSSQQKVDVLVQIPAGAIPVQGGRYTRGTTVDLAPYNTQALEYYFYFPAPGEFTHFPVHISANGATLAHADSQAVTVVERPSTVDAQAWPYLSQYAELDDVLAYLREQNLHKIDLSRIAFRMQDADAFEQVLEALRARHVYADALWSYGLKHNAPEAVREYLTHAENFVGQLGPYIDSQLLRVDPVVRHTYQHRDYRPLVNARAHTLGRRRQIVNDRFHEQYHRLLEVLSYQPRLGDDDRMELTAYLLLQDRVAEALDMFARVRPENLTTQLQYDYFAAYLDCYNDSPERAAAIASRYANHPVDRWRESFAAIGNLVAEVRGSEPRIADEDDRTQRQTQLANAQPGVDLQIKDERVAVAHRNLRQVVVNFYEMDLELLFSRQPFVQQSSDHFSYIRPNHREVVELPEGSGTIEVEIPESLRRSNLLVEVTGGGQRRVETHYANTLDVQMMSNYGHLRVTHRGDARAMPRVYVKVYAQMNDGQVRFYKDGYTDIRGRFDYASLSTNELDGVAKFALLVVSDEHGATVRDTPPPKR